MMIYDKINEYVRRNPRVSTQRLYARVTQMRDIRLVLDYRPRRKRKHWKQWISQCKSDCSQNSFIDLKTEEPLNASTVCSCNDGDGDDDYNKFEWAN